jgi:predicted MPP superfamily phosphohydrolase
VATAETPESVITPAAATTLSRRRFLKWGLASGAALVAGGIGYSVFEAGWLKVAAQSITIPTLPAAFKGLRIAFLSDIHHGGYTGLAYIRNAVRQTLELEPDLILLGGDYVHRSPRYIRPCFEALSELRASLGVFGVLGNHDHWESRSQTSSAMREAGITELTNSGVWLARNGQRLRVGGVGDFWEDTQDLPAALGDAGSEDVCVLLSHNPDYAELVRDARVKLIVSGHTHGGQAVFPFVGAPVVPSRYGEKYRAGLVNAPATQVYISQGIGTITPPVRFCCRPEISLLTLC